MSRFFSFHTATGAIAVVMLLLTGCQATEATQDSLTKAGRAALDNLYATAPAAEGLADKAEATLVFPSVTQAGFFVGGQYGRGVMYKHGQAVGFYNIAGGSFGLQAGAQTFSQAYFFTTPKALQTFEASKGFEVGVGVDVAVASTGVSGEISSSTLQKPIVAFVWGQQGLMAGAKIEGQKITKLEQEN